MMEDFLLDRCKDMTTDEGFAFFLRMGDMQVFTGAERANAFRKWARISADREFADVFE